MSNKKHEFDPNCAKCQELVRQGKIELPPGEKLKAQGLTPPPVEDKSTERRGWFSRGRSQSTGYNAEAGSSKGLGTGSGDSLKTGKDGNIAGPDSLIERSQGGNQQGKGIGAANADTDAEQGAGVEEKPVRRVFTTPDGPLRPHNASPRGELLFKSPRVLITPDAYKRMCLYIDIAPKEVGWLGTVSQRDNGDFLIEEVFLVEQEVTSVETELSVAGREKLVLQLLANGDDEGIERANKLRFWGHSHVRMSTGPSGTDENTMLQFGAEGQPWYIRGIFTKLGRGEFTIYQYDRGYRIIDAPWAVWDPAEGKVILEPKRFGGYFGGYRRSWESEKGTDGFGSIFGVRREEPVVLKKTDDSLPALLVADDALRASVRAEYDAKVSERIPVFSWFRKDKDKDGEGGQSGGDRQIDAVVDNEGIPIGQEVTGRVIRKDDRTIQRQEEPGQGGGFWSWLADLFTFEPQPYDNGGRSNQKDGGTGSSRSGDGGGAKRQDRVTEKPDNRPLNRRGGTGDETGESGSGEGRTGNGGGAGTNGK